ncbi:MAG: hypothetical protein H6810_08610 [Phycisphaeraceae bacterium]|nr:MAG: hypothetical protein H6810_08610 [Phycisphaeraceae bacterium]
MKRILIPIIAAGLLAGCRSAPQEVSREWDDDARGDTNAWLMRTYFDTQTTNGITSQHTIYPHHFVDGTAELTVIGRRDIAALAEHYTRYGGGELVMPNGGVSTELYQARVDAVRDCLRSDGADPTLVAFSDGVWKGVTTASTRAGADFARPSSQDPYHFHDQEAGQ